MNQGFFKLEPGGRPVPTKRLLLLALLPLPALLLAPLGGAVVPLVLLVNGVLLLLAAMDFLAARAHPLELERTLPARFSVGVPNKVSLAVRNRGARRASVSVWDHVPPGFVKPGRLHEGEPESKGERFSEAGAFEEDLITMSIPAFEISRCSLRLAPSSRGAYSFGDLYVRLTGPLGLCGADRIAMASVGVKVYPDLRGAGRLLLSGGARDLVSQGVRLVRREGEGSELSALRDYEPGDSYRDVDWKATARRDEPIVRAREPERSQTLLVCVDAGRLMAARTGGLSKLDHAVNAALLLSFVALRCDDRVGLLLFADEVLAWVPPGKGRLQYGRILEALYGAQASLTYVDYRELVRTVLARQQRRALVVT
ncbi:MAG: DUF58 domain-containing protein, partial [Myxococcota bacterium]